MVDVGNGKRPMSSGWRQFGLGDLLAATFLVSLPLAWMVLPGPGLVRALVVAMLANTLIASWLAWNGWVRMRTCGQSPAHIPSQAGSLPEPSEAEARLPQFDDGAA